MLKLMPLLHCVYQFFIGLENKETKMFSMPEAKENPNLIGNVTKPSIGKSIFQFKTRKYPLRRYILGFLGVLMHTTAWDQLWGVDIFLRLYIHSSASPRVAAV